MRSKQHITPISSSSSTSSQLATKRSSNKIIKQSPVVLRKTRRSIKSIVKTIQDEVIDMYDAVVFAETNQERMEEIVDILDRHKVVLIVGTAALVVKSRLGVKSAQVVAKDLINELRAAEAKKWGTALR